MRSLWSAGSSTHGRRTGRVRKPSLHGGGGGRGVVGLACEESVAAVVVLDCIARVHTAGSTWWWWTGHVAGLVSAVYHEWSDGRQVTATVVAAAVNVVVVVVAAEAAAEARCESVHGSVVQRTTRRAQQPYRQVQRARGLSQCAARRPGQPAQYARGRGSSNESARATHIFDGESFPLVVVVEAVVVTRWRRRRGGTVA